MSRNNDKPLKEAIQYMLQAYGIKRKFDETAIVNAWPEIMGPAVANRTQRIYIREKKLYVKLGSSVAKNELIMIRSLIIEKVNEFAENQVIDEIIFL